jgi:hypothetical protein
MREDRVEGQRRLEESGNEEKCGLKED